MVDTENLILQNEYLTREVKRQTQEVKVHIDRMSALNQVASTVSQSLDLDKTLDTALRAVTRVCHAEAGGISLIDTTTDEVVLRAQLGWENNFLNPPMRIPTGKGMSGSVINRDDVLVIDDLNGEFDVAVPGFRDEPFRSLAMAPMHARGKIIGILSIMSEKASAFDTATVDILKTVADTVGVALDNASLYEQSIENQNRLTAILQSSADGIIATDHNGFVSMINPSAERMLQVGTEDALNKQLRDVDMPRELQDPLRIALSSRDESPEKSFQVKLPDRRYLVVFVSPVSEGDTPVMMSNRDGWVIVLHDVTYLREAEEMKAQFIQAAAHDMRNPIGVTMTSLGTLQRIATDDLSQEIIDIALSGVNRLQTLIDDLLNLERIEHGHIFNMQETDITELIYEVGEHVRPLAMDKQQTWAIDVQGTLGNTQADSHWISRSIINYASNAVKYTPEGTDITLRAFTKADRIHIEVMDNGPGIPLEVQSRLFERFYQVQGASSQKGSGLGLAIVKSVVESHGGGVYMRSRVGEGSTFGMTLPTLAT